MRKTSHFHCDANYHFAEFTKSSAVPIVYSLAYRLTRRKDVENTGKFTACAKNVAEHYNFNEKSIDRAFALLLKLGFFVLVWSGKATRESSVYRVLSHEQWAEKYPDHCCVKDEKPVSVPARTTQTASNPVKSLVAVGCDYD